MNAIPRTFRAPAAVVVALIASVLFAAGCASTSSDRLERLEAADLEFAVGNYHDAVRSYDALLEEFSTGSERGKRILLHRAIALHELGEFERALQAFEDLAIERYGKDDQIRARLTWGRTALELGRRAEPVSASAELGSVAEEEALQRAAVHFRDAREHFDEIRDELQASNLDAALGDAEALLRLGQARDAKELLEKIEDRAEGDKRFEFLYGRVIQDLLGNGRMTPASSYHLRRALEADQQGHFDYHVAYRDVLATLAPFAKPIDLRTEYRDRPEILRNAEAMVALLGRYRDAMRQAHGAWGARLLADVKQYSTRYERHLHEEGDSETLITRAKEIVRDGDDLKFIDEYRRALDLLDGVSDRYTHPERFDRVRRFVLASYLRALVENAERLKNVGEFEHAYDNLEEARVEVLDQVWMPDAADLSVEEAEGLEARVTPLRAEIAARRDLEREKKKIREHLERGELAAAERAIDVAKLAMLEGDAEAMGFVGDDLASFLGDVRAALQESETLRRLSSIWQAAESSSIEPEESLVHLAEGLRIAWLGGDSETADVASPRGSFDIPPGTTPEFPIWASRFRTELAWRYYELGRFEDAYDEIRTMRDLEFEHRLFLGLVLYRLGDFEGATKFFKDQEDAAGLDDRYRVAAGLSFVEVGREEAARSCLERVENKSPEVVDALATIYRGRLTELARAGIPSADHDSDERLEALKVRRIRLETLGKLHALVPDDRDVRLDLAAANYEEGVLRSSRSHFERARELYAGVANVPDGEHADRYGKLVAVHSMDLGSFDFRVGTTWRYESASDGSTRTETIVGRDGPDRFRVRIVRNGERESRETWEVDRTRRVLLQFATRSDRSRQLPLFLATPRTPLPVHRYLVSGEPVVSRMHRVGLTVVTPTGRFRNCVEIEDGVRSDFIRRSLWAPEVGKVKFDADGTTYLLAGRGVAPPEETRVSRLDTP